MTKLGYVVKVQSVIKNNKDTSGLSPYEKKIYNEVKNRFAVDLAKGGAYTNDYSGSPAIVRAGLSDIYGGITNNIIVDGRGHWGKRILTEMEWEIPILIGTILMGKMKESLQMHRLQRCGHIITVLE